ncbi:hypothetical protein [Ferrovibrio sp.]|uniref:hypothetical protein n=1 Tax=Ferrovibrio sp. TaxID=1917215 RepID=UPI00311F363A
MAINTLLFQLTAKSVQLLRERAGQRRLSALAFAYPDFIMPKEALEQVLGADFVQGLPERPDSAAVRKMHGGSGPVYDSMALLDRLGIDLAIVDVVALRGIERIIDLNDPLPDDLRRRFDLVIDPGTCEHCFNVGMAFRNVCEAVGPGGFLVHNAPFTFINHGFWNFSPTVYPDYFDANGFKLHYLGGQALQADGSHKSFPVDAFRRFAAPLNGILYVAAERIDDRPPVWPVQHKYKAMLGAKG